MSEVSTEEARDIAEQLRTAVEHSGIDLNDIRRTLNVTASIGVSAVKGGSTVTPERIIGLADEALYRAKHEGRNRIRLFDPGETLERMPKVAA